MTFSSGALHFYLHHTAACTGLLVSSCLDGNQWGDTPNELHKILQRHRLSKCPLMTFRSGGFRLDYYLSFWLIQNASLQLRWVVQSQIIVYAKNILVNQKELNNNFFRRQPKDGCDNESCATFSLLVSIAFVPFLYNVWWIHNWSHNDCCYCKKDEIIKIWLWIIMSIQRFTRKKKWHEQLKDALINDAATYKRFSFATN